MDPLTIRRVRGATRLAHDAFDAAVPAIARAHRDIADAPFAILERVEPICAPVGVVKVVHDALTDTAYETIRSINRLLAELTIGALDCAEAALPVARGDDSSPVPR